MSLTLSSPAFPLGGTIPAAHTGAGADASPPLAWSGAPEGTRAFALVVDDPDAPGRTWVHWLAWDIPGGAQALPAGVPPTEPGFVQGRNDFGRVGYGGPMPPKGQGAHRYFFRLYALDRRLDLPAGATRLELEAAMRGRVLDRAECMGKYHRDR